MRYVLSALVLMLAACQSPTEPVAEYDGSCTLTTRVEWSDGVGVSLRGKYAVCPAPPYVTEWTFAPDGEKPQTFTVIWNTL